MMSINKKNFTIVAKNLLNELLLDISGENEDWLFGKKPSEHVMVGMIDGERKESSIIRGEMVDNQRFDSIPSLGLRFKVDNNTNSVSFSMKGKLFYRVLPSYEEQILFLKIESSKRENIEFKDFNEVIDYYTKLKNNPEYVEPKYSIVYKYKSVNLDSLGSFNLDVTDITNSVDSINNLIAVKINSIIDRIRYESVSIKKVNRFISSYFTEAKFSNILNAALEAESNALPNWNIMIYSSVEFFDNYKEIVLQMVNNTDKIASKGSYETAIFNGGLIVESTRGFIPYDFNSIKYNYNDNPISCALGNNCTVIKNGNKLITENIPIYEQKRVITIDKFNEYIEFEKLVDNPVCNLQYIYNEMEKRYNAYLLELRTAERIKEKKYVDAFKEEIDDFYFEINRFKKGIDLINNYSVVKKSFELMNLTFGLGKYKGWRMFQIVFIVSEIADIINCEYEGTPGFSCNDINNVDLIYFPTGGGKTESFLGCSIFAAFFDRLRGKSNGATAIIKYPLRLLAAQQLDRILGLTISANIIKNKYQVNGDEFSVGFFTGSKNTPNKIDKQKVDEIENLPQDLRNQLYRQIDYCPICAKNKIISEMNVFFDYNKWTLKHKCSNENCGYEPPIYIVDDEIYRFAPTFVISTIDKMANIGTSLGFKSLFGQSKNKCEKHGFTLSNNKCNVPGCKCSIHFDVERKDPVPTLFIQDEMHLVNESLGTFDSHYESFLQYYASSLVDSKDRKKIKFIGATATISNYKEHIRGLYNKNSKKFPTSIKGENFYSTIDNNDICRLIIGTALYGGSITECIQRVVTLMRIIISSWMKNINQKLISLIENGFDGDKNDLLKILNYYLITIIYNNSKNDAGLIRANLENIGNNTLASENIQNFDIAEISGDVEFKTIKNVMHNVESSEDKNNTKNVIVATSAISHGVDEDCFNQIFFFGMPNQTSEYIQAYSRVGRTYTGLVFDIFRIIRDRDKSYLKNFYIFHRYKDLLIDPVPINRYAKNAIYSTLPGIISGLIYQVYVKKYRAIDVTKEIAQERLKLETIIHDIEEIYECDNQSSILYKNIIEAEVTKIFNGFKTNTNSEISVSDLIKAVDSKHKGPMTNLRDVDVPLELYMKGD